MTTERPSCFHRWQNLLAKTFGSEGSGLILAPPVALVAPFSFSLLICLAPFFYGAKDDIGGVLYAAFPHCVPCIAYGDARGRVAQIVGPLEDHIAVQIGCQRREDALRHGSATLVRSALQDRFH